MEGRRGSAEAEDAVMAMPSMDERRAELLHHEESEPPSTGSEEADEDGEITSDLVCFFTEAARSVSWTHPAQAVGGLPTSTAGTQWCQC